MFRWQAVTIFTILTMSLGLFFIGVEPDVLYVSNADRLLPCYTKDVSYTLASPTVCFGDVAVLSNIVYSMKQDGWSIKFQNIKDGVYDVALNKGNDICRLIKEGDIITSISVPYESSYIPMQYLRKE